MDDFGTAVMVRYYVHLMTVIIAAAVIIGISERAFGLNIRGVIDNIEKAAGEGQVLPAVILLTAGLLAVVYVLG